MDIDLLSNIFYAMVRCGTPLLLVALGELVCEKSGVLNLGQEGMMQFGAVIGFIVDFNSGNRLASPNIADCGKLTPSGSFSGPCTQYNSRFRAM